MASISELLERFPVSNSMPDELMLENVKSALGRRLPTVTPCRPHNKWMAIAAGGPSLEDTYDKMTGLIASVNGSLGFLLERDIVPWACGVLDPGAHMKEIVATHPRVRYFVASVCHPSLFDYLLGAGCQVGVWHPSGVPGLQELLAQERGRNWTMVHGGSTMGLRWFNIGHTLGFRTFHGHGLDSSFRKDRTHAYADRRDGMGSFEVKGHWTHPNFAQQAVDFLELLHRWSEPDIEPVNIEIFGDGLIPSLWEEYRKEHPTHFKGVVPC